MNVIDNNGNPCKTGSNEELSREEATKGPDGATDAKAVATLQDATFAVDAERKCFVAQIPITAGPWHALGLLKFVEQNVMNFYAELAQRAQQSKSGLVLPGQKPKGGGFLNKWR